MRSRLVPGVLALAFVRAVALAAAVALALLAGVAPSDAQQDLKPLQTEVDNLKQQNSKLQADLAAAKKMSVGGAEIRTGAGLCLDVFATHRAKNGGRVQVWACNGADQQRWTYDPAARSLRIASGLCLDIDAPEIKKNGGRVQVWACTGAPQQQWTPANGALRNAGGQCLDVHAPEAAKNGGRVQVWQCNGSQQQRFTSKPF